MPLTIIDLIKAVKDGTVESTGGQKKAPRSTSETRFYLDFVSNKMKEYEEKKYPSPIYTYNKISLAVDGKRKEVTHVTYSAAPVDESRYLYTFEDNALIVRKLSVIAGILNALEFANLEDRFLGINSEGQLKAILELLGEQLNIGGLLFPDKTTIDLFINNLVALIAAKTNTTPKRIISDIRTAERYFVADYKHNHLLINEITIDSEKSIFQVDEYLGNQLTEEQKREFLSIHVQPEENRPLWFRGLSSWEQTWLLKQVPTTLEESWADFESLSQSSAMSHIPGIQNARMNSLVTFDGKEYTLLSRSLKTSTMVPYELHVAKKDRAFYVKQTAEQVLGYLSQEVTRDFDQIWAGLGTSGRPRPLIFVQSLLSDTVIDRLVATADTRLTREQRRAIQEISLSGTYPDVTIVTGNDPMNFLRFGDALSGGLSKKFNRWAHTDSILSYAKQFIAYLELELAKNTLNPEQVARFILIKAAQQEISNLRNENFIGQGGERNFVAFKAAYTSILVESMGGIVSTNCKSGKDRTGVEELYKNAMIYYYSIYGVLPKFDDQGVARKNFVDIFVLLFNSMKAQESASGNTPGSLGMKLDPTMLCSDIRAALKTTYNLSVTLASLNKPPLFIESETSSVKLRKVSISSFNNASPTKPVELAKQLEKDVTAFAKLHPVADKLMPFASFRKSVTEYGAEPEMLTPLREHFAEIQDDVNDLELLTASLIEFTQEVRDFINSFTQTNPQLNEKQKRSMKQLDLLLQIIANGEELFFKSYDLMSTVQVLKFSTLTKLKTQFVEHKQRLLDNQTKEEISPKTVSSPRISDNPHTYFISPGSGKVRDFIKQYNELSKEGNAPIISPTPGSSGAKVK
ncbi:MAG: hypothetical protein P4L79_08115 [Legionella sp.]|uniref:hypothetical protein n=1 Tax=Legionella sp. TaxID=459 RepID=UPI00284ADAF6|nr:hypothetical protein [Legionella sp.]